MHWAEAAFTSSEVKPLLVWRIPRHVANEACWASADRVFLRQVCVSQQTSACSLFMSCSPHNLTFEAPKARFQNCFLQFNLEFNRTKTTIEISAVESAKVNCRCSLEDSDVPCLLFLHSPETGGLICMYSEISTCEQNHTCSHRQE